MPSNLVIIFPSRQGYVQIEGEPPPFSQSEGPLPMNRADWNLLVLAAAGGESLSPVQYQKALFLVSRNLPEEVLGGPLYNFEPYNYGPFDPAVYHDAIRLVAQRLAVISKSPRGWTQYEATPQ